jgi:hypothetical protein
MGKIMSKKAVLLSEKINWKPLDYYVRIKGGLLPDGMTLAFASRAKDSGKIDQIRIRIGKNFAQKLGWKAHDKIAFYYDNENIKNILLVKSDNMRGYSLQQEAKSENLRLHIRWSQETKLPELYPTEVIPIIEGKKIIINVPREVK